MGIFDMLQKGLPDWHLLLNKNFNAAQAKFDGLDTQMSNKADKSRTVLDSKRDYQNYTTVLEMVNAVSDDSSVIAFGDVLSSLYNAEDRPPTLSEYFYVILSDGIKRKNVIAFGFTGRNIYMRRVYDKKWSVDWTQVATSYCADMEWKSLPMINGWTKFNDDPKAALKYRKGADGKVVYVEGFIKQPNPLTAANKTIACLPEGYRPKNFWWQTSTPEYKEGSVSLRVNTDGKVFLTSTADYLQVIVSDSLPVCLTIPI